MKTWKEFVSEETLDEAYKGYVPTVPKSVAELAKLIADETDTNSHAEARWALATFLKDKKLVNAYEAIMILHDYFKDANDIISARSRLDKALFYVAKQKLSKEEYELINNSF